MAVRKLWVIAEMLWTPPNVEEVGFGGAKVDGIPVRAEYAREFSCESDPSPRFVRAVAGLPRSDRLLAGFKGVNPSGG